MISQHIALALGTSQFPLQVLRTISISEHLWVPNVRRCSCRGAGGDGGGGVLAVVQEADVTCEALHDVISVVKAAFDATDG